MPFINIVICLLLLGCTDSSEKKQEIHPPHIIQKVSRENRAAHSQKDLSRADELLAYHNKVQGILGQGMLADRIYANTSIYDATWKLPPRQKSPRPGVLAPPQGLFTGAEAAALTSALRGMDGALNTMLGHYAALEKYVLDPAIHDDGKEGKQQVQKILAAHNDYLQARKSFLGIVDEQARQAEKIILAEHPLQRQIIAAQDIFIQFREAAHIIASGGSQQRLLKAINDNILEICAGAGAPPFTASPNLERLYRKFLKSVQEYCRILSRAIDEGCHAPQRREINIAQETARRAYNEFARAANSQA